MTWNTRSAPASREQSALQRALVQAVLHELHTRADSESEQLRAVYQRVLDKLTSEQLNLGDAG